LRRPERSADISPHSAATSVPPLDHVRRSRRWQISFFIFQRRVVSASADLNAPLIFRRIQRRPAFRRWTTSGEAAGGRFLF